MFCCSIIACRFHLCLFPVIGNYFGWMTSLMCQGYKRPIIEKDVWKLDSWDQTEILSRKFVYDIFFFSWLLYSWNFNVVWHYIWSEYFRFQNSLAEKAQRSKPWLLHPLKSSLRGRYIFIYDVIFFFEFMKQLNDILIQMPQLAYGWQFPFGDFFIFHFSFIIFCFYCSLCLRTCK